MPQVGTQPISWKKRLNALLHHPTKEEVMVFIQDSVKPALQEVADEMGQRNLKVRVEQGEDGRVWLEVLHGEEIDFFYSVRPRIYTPPAFAMRDTRKKRGEKLKFYRGEVHLSEGGQDYDVMGWTKEQIITDVVDHYEKHLHFPHTVR